MCVCVRVREKERKKEREVLIEGGIEVSTRGDRNVEKKRRKGEIRGRGNPDHFGGPPTPFASTFSVHIVRSCPVKESLNHCFLSLPINRECSYFPRFPYEFKFIVQAKEIEVKKRRC